jgi:hypothetical protein
MEDHHLVAEQEQPDFEKRSVTGRADDNESTVVLLERSDGVAYRVVYVVITDSVPSSTPNDRHTMKGTLSSTVPQWRAVVAHS